jgi:hypothetical protein
MPPHEANVGHRGITGWASGTFFISCTTLGALDELVYIVDYSKAGIVNYTVTVPELSSLWASWLGIFLLTRRRR